MMYRLILATTALTIAPALNAQVHRSTTVHRTGGATVHRSTAVHHTTTRHAAVAHPVYRPGAWHGRVVHAGVYRYPHGYAYRRWAVGGILPRAFLAPAYYYSGYAALGLAAPPANYHWVRYGPDLLLVNAATGNVVDIRYGVFAQ